MGILFLILFTLAEVALVVLTFTKFSEKAAWLKNRTIIRAIELVLLLGIILLPATTMKWRFLFALAILAIRLISSIVEWLVNRRSVSGIRNKAAAVVCCVVSVFFMTVSAAPALPFVNFDDLPTKGEFNASEIDGMIAERFAQNLFGVDSSSID